MVSEYLFPAKGPKVFAKQGFISYTLCSWDLIPFRRCSYLFLPISLLSPPRQCWAIVVSNLSASASTAPALIVLEKKKLFLTGFHGHFSVLNINKFHYLKATWTMTWFQSQIPKTLYKHFLVKNAASSASYTITIFLTGWLSQHLWFCLLKECSLSLSVIALKGTLQSHIFQGTSSSPQSIINKGDQILSQLLLALSTCCSEWHNLPQMPFFNASPLPVCCGPSVRATRKSPQKSQKLSTRLNSPFQDWARKKGHLMK